MRAHALVLDTAFGLITEKSIEENVRAMDQYFALGTQQSGESRRQAVQSDLKTLDVKFNAHDAEVGWFYDFGSLSERPQMRPHGKMELRVYLSAATLGHQLPYAWLTSAQCERRSTGELVREDKLLLLETSPSRASFAHNLVQVKVLGDGYDEWRAADEAWRQQCRFPTSRGVLLVRPDNNIAHRFDDDGFLRLDGVASRIETIVQHALYM